VVYIWKLTNKGVKNMKEKIIIKIGTSTLTEGSNNISLKKIEEIAEQIKELKEIYDIILVSS